MAQQPIEVPVQTDAAQRHEASLMEAARADLTCVTIDRIALSPTCNSIFDEDGSAIVIHAAPDDQNTDPDGNSGDRIACGTIEK